MIPLRSTSNRIWGVWVRKAFQLLGGMLGLLLLCLPVYSQGSFGRILGTVVDQSGGTVANAAERGALKRDAGDDPELLRGAE